MNKKDNLNIGAIILAAGKGTRMQCRDKNKVAMVLGDKPIILRIVNLLEDLKLGSIIVVVGFAKESVKEALVAEKIIYAEQIEQRGTAHAVEIGLEKVAESITDILIIYGDDASFYPASLLENMIEQHCLNNAAVTFITFSVANPQGLGRVIRDDDGNVQAIIEEKNASDEQKKITEVNSGCYMFNKAFLQKYLPKVEKNSVSGEYYLTDTVELALKNDEIVNTVEGGNLPWRGINTMEELKVAEQQISPKF